MNAFVVSPPLGVSVSAPLYLPSIVTKPETVTFTRDLGQLEYVYERQKELMFM